MTFSPIGYGHSVAAMPPPSQLSQSPGVPPTVTAACDPLVGGVGAVGGAILGSYHSGLSTTEQHLQAVAGLYAPYAAAATGRFGLGAATDPSLYMQSVQQGYAHTASAAAAAAWRGAAAASVAHQALQQPGMATTPYGYEPASAAAAWHSAAYAYPNNPGIHDLNGQRRKNATRESTATLKAWLNEHKSNPYPTKGEKIMLAIITKMTLTQVSTWFANARRRLKKENKMTWSPRNRGEDDNGVTGGDLEGGDASDHDESVEENLASGRLTVETGVDPVRPLKRCVDGPDINQNAASEDMDPAMVTSGGIPVAPPSACCRVGESGRPKIWSLAYTATSSSPPPPPKKRCPTPTIPPPGELQ